MSTGTVSDGEPFAPSGTPDALLVLPGGLWMGPLIPNAPQAHDHRALQTTTSSSLPSARHMSEFTVLTRI